MRSVLTLMATGLDAPDHTTLSRRGQPLDVALDRVPTHGPVDLVVDSTGLSVFGEGEWAKAKHGGRGKRGWKKLHLGVDRSVSSSLRRSRSRPRMTPRLASGL